jgi:hypothetical protein
MGETMNRTQTSVSRPTLVQKYFRSQSLVQVALAALWTLVLVGLTLLFLLYSYVKVINSGYPWLAFAAFVVLLLWLLFVVEGAEISVAALRDKDADQLDDSAARKMLLKIKQYEGDFLNGRQALMISIIVLVTLMSAQIAVLEGQWTSSDLLPSQVNGLLANEIVRAFFVFGFPNFVVLWTAQLYPKLLATNAPQSRFSLPSHQKVMSVAIAIGRFTNIGAPSSLLALAVDGIRLGGHSNGASQLRPSRREMYRSQSTFIFGMGLKQATREIVISDDGSVDVMATQVREILTEGVRALRSTEAWAAPIVSDSVNLQVTGNSEDNKPVVYWTVALAEIEGKSVEGGKLELRVDFPDPLDVGTSVTENLTYRTEPKAMTKEYYWVSVVRPVENLEVTIRPQDQGRSRFVGGVCTVEGMDQNEVLSRQEQSRIELKAIRGGYKATARFPLVGTRMKITWQSRRI